MQIFLSSRALAFLGNCSAETAHRLELALEDIAAGKIPIVPSAAIARYGYVFLGDYDLGLTVDAERGRVTVQRIAPAVGQEPF